MTATVHSLDAHRESLLEKHPLRMAHHEIVGDRLVLLDGDRRPVYALRAEQVRALARTMLAMAENLEVPGA